MEPLKEMFNQRFFEKLGVEFKKVYPAFEYQRFLSEIMDGLEHLSLNQRMRRATEVLHGFLPKDYAVTVEILMAVIKNGFRGYPSLLFPDYIGQFGLQHFEASMKALKYFTTFGSSEFAIREFLKNDFKRTLKIMEQWAGDTDPHVRRLASEGSRPRLPWSFKLDEVIAHPEVTARILDKLKADPEIYVRKSVANHLNDLSKDNPDYMLRVLRGWDISNPQTAWIIRHASRSLIKKGNADSLSVFKYEKDPKVEIHNMQLNKRVKLGGDLAFSFDLESKKKKDQKLVIDYIIHYCKKGGALSPKVFKLKDVTLASGAVQKISKKQRLQDFTTRKHYPGKHQIQLQVNGKIVYTGYFHLTT
jgi:3-methyladenine DNA glycosylase AlkC